jgi:protein phosphatase PTC7
MKVKEIRINTTLPYLFVSGAYQMPHPDKSDLGPGGEDSYFISTDNVTVGVADGVGGWRKYEKTFSHIWSQGLMNLCEKHSENHTSPFEIIKHAYEDINKDIVGSTTVTVVRLSEESQSLKLNFYSIGDSLCSVYREGSGVVFSTNKTSYEFNYPYQLGSREISTVYDGTNESCEVEQGDILICASDGVWDNLFHEDIEEIIIKVSSKYHMQHRLDAGTQRNSTDENRQSFVKELARQVVRQAYIRGSVQNTETPFSESAGKAGYDSIGGKLDDTTAIVSYIVVNEIKEQSEELSSISENL